MSNDFCWIKSVNDHDLNYLGMLDTIEKGSDYEKIAGKECHSFGYLTSLFEEEIIILITPYRGNMQERVDFSNRS